MRACNYQGVVVPVGALRHSGWGWVWGKFGVGVPRILIPGVKRIGQLHSPAALTLGREPPVSIQYYSTWTL